MQQQIHRRRGDDSCPAPSRAAAPEAARSPSVHAMLAAACARNGPPPPHPTPTHTPPPTHNPPPPPLHTPPSTPPPHPSTHPHPPTPKPTPTHPTHTHTHHRAHLAPPLGPVQRFRGNVSPPRRLAAPTKVEDGAAAALRRRARRVQGVGRDAAVCKGAVAVAGTWRGGGRAGGQAVGALVRVGRPHPQGPPPVPPPQQQPVPPTLNGSRRCHARLLCQPYVRCGAGMPAAMMPRVQGWGAQLPGVGGVGL